MKREKQAERGCFLKGISSGEGRPHVRARFSLVSASFLGLLSFVALAVSALPSSYATELGTAAEESLIAHAPVRCPGAKVDLRQGAGSMRRVAPSDQGETNLCAFHAASQLLSAWSNTQGISEAPLDPIALAVDFAADTKWPYWMPVQSSTDPLSDRFGRWGGTVCPLVGYARERGACSDPGVFSRFGGDDLGDPSDRAAKVYRVLARYAVAKKRDRAELLNVLPAEFLRVLHESMPFAAFAAADVPIPTEEDVRQALMLHGSSPYAVLRAVAFPDCEKKRTRPMEELPECGSSVYAGLDLFGIRLEEDRSRTSKASEKIIDLLRADRALPVPVAHCSSVYDEGRSYRGRSILSQKCGAHWSLVIGMREEKDGSCSFLVRSSYDLEGKTYSPDWKMDAPGDAWVDARTFERSVYMIQWLRD